MAAGTYDLFIEQGATFIQDFEYFEPDGTTPIDLTGYTARMQIRSNKASNTALADLTTTNGKLAIDGPNGKVTITIPATDTEGYAFTTGVYDLELVNGSIVTRFIQGKVTVDPEVTR
jgi:hypothetical protein